ncbi:MAG TPA: DUF6265 family protein [Longimicrobium sp.]|nr:DUF6265 family protein [Longimicrobium sp.]
MPIFRPTSTTTISPVALILVILAAAPAVAQGQQPERPLAALSFMAGCWRGDAGVDRSIEEQWTAADSDVMLAMTRYLDDNTGRTRGWELSRIVADSAGIVLVPAPMGTAQGRFRLTSSRPGEARFEDPSHDFPKRITYYRVDARTLMARLDGGEGNPEDVVFRMESVPCPGPSVP